MNTWKVILATLVIFVAGVVTGGLIIRQSQRIKAPRPPHTSAERPIDPAPHAISPRHTQTHDFLRRIQRELDLTPEQRTHIEQIINESQERTRKHWEQVAPQLRKEVQETRDRIRAELTPAQQERFEELLKQPRLRPRPDDAPPSERRPRPPREPQSDGSSL